jgi:hypothetical protein
MPTRKLPNPDDFQDQKFYVGIDVHKKSWAVTVRSLNFVVAHFTQPPSPAALLSQLLLTCVVDIHRNPGERLPPATVPTALLLRFGQSGRLSSVCPEVLVHLPSSGSRPASPAAACSCLNSSGSISGTGDPCNPHGTSPGSLHPLLRLLCSSAPSDRLHSPTPTNTIRFCFAHFRTF